MKMLKSLFAAIALLCCVVNASAQTTKTWVGTTTAWATAGNWSPSGVPAGTDHVVFNGSGTAQPTLDANRSVANITVTGNTVNLNSKVLTVTGTTTLTAGTVNSGTINFTNTTTTFGGTTFGSKVKGSCTNIYFNGSTFNGSVSLTKTGTAANSSTGGNTFNDSLIIKSSGYNITLHSTTNNDAFNGHIVLSSTACATCPNHGIIAFGAVGGTGVGTLTSGKTITIGASGFAQGGISFIRFTQSGSTAQSFTLTGTAQLKLGDKSGATLAPTTWNGNVTFSSPNLLVENSTFNGTATITKTGTSSNTCNGNNTFNSTCTYNVSSSGYLTLANITGDTYNGTANFNQNSTGLIYPGNNGDNYFYGNVAIITNNNAVTFNNSASGYIYFRGSAAQTLSKTGTGLITVNRFTMGKTANSLTLSTPVKLGGANTFDGGTVITTSTNILIFKDNATCSVTNTASYVSGPVAKEGNDAFTFPTGKNSMYRSLGIAAPTNTATVFTAEYFNSNQALGAPTDTSLSNFSDCEYWTLTRSGSSDNVNVTPSWKSTSCNGAKATNMRVASWNGSTWLNLGNGARTGNNTAGTVTTGTTPTAFNAFTLANKTCTSADTAYITPLGTTTFCSYSNLTLLANNAKYYTWSTGAHSQSIIINTAATFSVTIKDTSGCAKTSASLTTTTLTASSIVGEDIIALVQRKDISYDSIVTRGNAYFKHIRSCNGNVLTRQEKFFRRWESFWYDRVFRNNANPHGIVNVDLPEFLDWLPDDCDNEDWSLIGPQNLTSQMQGLVTSIAVNNNDLNTIYIGTGRGGLWKTTNGGTNWVNITDDSFIIGSNGQNIPGPCISSIYLSPTDPNLIYIGLTAEGEINSNGYGAGLWRSTDGGDNWDNSFINTGQPFKLNFLSSYGNVFVKGHPSNDDILFASKTDADNCFLYRSTNGGSTWTLVLTIPKEVESVRNENTGSYWNLDNRFNIIDIEFNLNDPTKIILSTNATAWGSKVYVADNGGVAGDWEEKSGGANGINKALANAIGSVANIKSGKKIEVDYSPLHTNRFYISVQDSDVDQYREDIYQDDSGHIPFSNFLHILYTDDNGATWNSLGKHHALNTGWGNTGGIHFSGRTGFEVSDVNSQTIFIGGMTVFKSIDGGNSYISVSDYWPTSNPSSTHADIRALNQIAPASGLERFLMGDDGGIAKAYSGVTNDNSWTNINNNGLVIAHNLSVSVCAKNGIMYSGVYHNGYINNNAGTWTYTSTGDYGKCYCNKDGFNHAALSSWKEYEPDPKDNDYYYTINKYNITVNNVEVPVNDLQRVNITNGSISVMGTLPVCKGEMRTIGVSENNPTILYVANGKGDSEGACLNSEDRFHKVVINGSHVVTSTTDYSGTTTTANTILKILSDAQLLGSGITDIEVDPNDVNDVYISLNGFDANIACRVLHSTNGGVTWVNMSTGLSPLPVLSLEYVKGTDDLIYAATDAGVFHWDKPQGKWICHSDAPSSIATDIDIDYCRGKIYASFDGRGIWESDLVTLSDHHITTSQTWPAGSFYTFANNVIIDPGVTLTVEGTASFAEGKSLIVKPTAKLIVQNSGILTNFCGNMWRGVQVWGDRTQQQTLTSGHPDYQGMAVVRSGGTIENAITGLNAIKLQTSGTELSGDSWNYCGGIIQASAANFKNNKQAINIHSYYSPNGSDNISYAIKCMFETTGLLNDPSIKPYEFIGFYDIKGFRILGNTFRNSNPTAFSTNQRGMGINTFNAKFRVQRHVPITGPSTVNFFQNLTTGISVRSTYSKQQILIDNNEFYNNFMGTYISAHNGIVFNKNLVSISPYYSGTPFLVQYGLMLANCNEYTVEENTFNPTITGGVYNDNSNLVGTIVYTSGDFPNRIYKNNYTSLLWGTWGYGDNRKEADQTKPGLQFLCNTYNSNEGDAVVTPINNIPINNQGIAESQGADIDGDNGSPAGNIFTNGTTLTEGDYRNATPQINYYHHDPVSGNNPKVMPVDITPIFVDPNNTFESYTTSGSNVSCPSHIATHTLSQLKSLKTANYNLYQAKSTLAGTLVDNGNTTAMVLRIDTTTAPNHSALRTYLLSKSPWLSNAALLKVAQELPDNIIFDVYMANPHGGRDKSLVETLKIELVPDSLVDLIELRADSITLRDTLMAKISTYNSLYNYFTDQVIAIHLSDTTYNGLDSAIAILKTINVLERKYDLISLFIDNGRVDSAMANLNSLPSHFTLVNQDLTNYNDVKYILKKGDSLNVYKNMYRWHNLTSIDLGKLQTIASTNLYFPGAYACNILAFIGNDTCEIDLELPGMSLPRYSNQVDETANINDSRPKNQNMSVYPNPANHTVNVKYNMSGRNNKFTLKLYNSLGQLVYDKPFNTSIEEIPLTNFKSGIYNVTLWEGSKMIESQKLIISE